MRNRQRKSDGGSASRIVTKQCWMQRDKLYKMGLVLDRLSKATRPLFTIIIEAHVAYSNC